MIGGLHAGQDGGGWELTAGLLQTMLKPFLQHHYWSRHGNIPALVILVQAYLQKAPQDIVEKQFVVPILGIFQMLLGFSRHYTDATALLASILAYLPMEVRRAPSPLPVADCLHSSRSDRPDVSIQRYIYEVLPPCGIPVERM